MNRPINRMRPIHPGNILQAEFLAPLQMSVSALASKLYIPAMRLHEIVDGRRAINADTAERLARYFGGDSGSWMALQANYELTTLATRSAILREVHPRNVVEYGSVGDARALLYRADNARSINGLV